MEKENLAFCSPRLVYANETSYATRACRKMLYDPLLKQCSEANTMQFGEEENSDMITLLYGYVLPVLAAIVIAANGIVIVVLCCQRSKRSTIDPLLAMAVCALMGAVVPLPFTLWYYTLDHRRDFDQPLGLCHLHKICMEILPFCFNTLTTLFTLLLGAQRFIAVHYPLQSYRWCSRKMMHRVSAICVIFTVIWTMVMASADFRAIFHLCLSDSNTESGFWVRRCVHGHTDLIEWVGVDLFATFFDLARVLLLTIAPCALLFFFTVMLIRAIKMADMEFATNRHRRSSTRSQSRNTTIMLIVVITMFLLAKAPSTFCIVLLKFAFFFPSGTAASLMTMIDARVLAIANIIVIAVHPITFAVYMLMSRRFRIALRKLLGWRFLASDDDLVYLASTRALTNGLMLCNSSRGCDSDSRPVNNQTTWSSLRVYHGSSLRRTVSDSRQSKYPKLDNRPRTGSCKHVKLPPIIGGNTPIGSARNSTTGLSTPLNIFSRARTKWWNNKKRRNVSSAY